MIDNLPTLALLLKQLQHVPYVASKNLYRIAHHFLEMDERALEHFCRTLHDAKKNLAKCTTCWAWKEREQLCLFCSPKRDLSIVCVVETWHDLYAIEKTGSFKGTYHVLGGAIYPLHGIGPEDLTINELINRINGTCSEIILAMNQTPEGEATAAFIARKLETKNVSITCLSRGIPVGSPLEFQDKLTLHKAITERRPF